MLSATYDDARRSFLAAAAEVHAVVTHHPHPLSGPDGGDLAIDVAELGPDTADDVVLVVSGTHGVEGYCGSALQRRWLESHAGDRPDGVRVVMVHALNPYGFAWVRRVNEDNVDLNRNFVDWAAGAPRNADYAEIADLLVPTEFSEAEQARTLGALLAIAEESGLDHLQSVISRGQYHHPTGLFYGGTGPVWSHRWLRSWAAAQLASCRRLTIIDLHTGLGPWGHGERIVVEAKGTPEYERAAALWGEVRSMLDGDSASAVLDGDWLSITHELAPRAEVTATALEFGTVDPLTVALALRADAWLHAHGDPLGADAAPVRAQVRAAFADDDPAWLDRTWEQFALVITQALDAAGGR